MRRVFFLFTLVGAASLACAAPQTRPADKAADQPPATAPSHVTAVTVYRGYALVTREVSVPEGVGPIELVVSPLPERTLDSSLYTEGGGDIRVLTTRFRSRAVREDTRAEVRTIEEQIARLRADGERLARDIQVIEQNLRFYDRLEGFTGTSMDKLTEKGMLNAESVLAITKYVVESRAQQSRALVELQQQNKANQESLGFAHRQLSELTAGASRTVRDGVIVVDKTAAGAGKVRLHYLVGAATWRPMYKLRAGDAKEPVQVEYLAAIEQQSGETWPDVEIALSTAQPMLSAAPPALLPLDMAPAQRRPLILGEPNKEQSREYRRQAATRPAAVGIVNTAAALEQQEELLNPREEAVADKPSRPAARPEGPSVTYHLKTRLTVPSRSDQQTLEVARIELAPDYFYKTVPVLSPHVYRLARLVNRSEYVLLPGEATMYVGSDFVGRMDLPLVAIGEQFTAGFGADPQLQVGRELVSKNRTIQGGNQVHTYEYRIRLSSFKSTGVKVEVHDRLPKTEQEAIGVTMATSKPELSTDPTYLRVERPDNLLRWDITVEPGMSGEKAATVTYTFKLEYGRNVTLGNFESKGAP